MTCPKCGGSMKRVTAAEIEPRPGLILDPFSGSGRTAIQAQRLGLNFVGCELNEEYAEMSRKLITNESPLFAEGTP